MSLSLAQRRENGQVDQEEKPMAERREWSWVMKDPENTPLLETRDHRPDLTNVQGGFIALRASGDFNFAWKPTRMAQFEILPLYADLENRPVLYEDTLGLVIQMPDFDSGWLTTRSEGSSIADIRGETDRGLSVTQNRRMEWRITGKPAGTQVRCGDRFGLFNTEKDDWLVFSSTGWGNNGQDPGIQLSELADNPLMREHTTVRLKPQLPTQGVVVWIGRFPLAGNPSHPDAFLEQVTVANLGLSSFVVGFLSKNQQPSTTVIAAASVKKGDSLTPADMMKVFGSATPPLPVEFRAVATNHDATTDIALNIDYMG
jgi:hypothetical protein